MRRLWLSMLMAIAGCKAVPVTPASTLDQLNASRGGHVSGPLVALSEPLVLNREDFVFDAKFSADGSRAAISRLAGDGFHASLFTLPSTRDADPLLNISEFDVEGLEFSPDGARVAAVSRDGTLRVLDAYSGALIATWKCAEALVSVAWSTRGERLAVGSSTGFITIVDAASLAWVADVAAHHDEVRGLGFRDDGSLVSASWDRTLQVHTLEDAVSDEARLRFRRVNGVFLVHGVARNQSVTVAFDARVPHTLIRAELARGLETVAGTITVATADGPQLAYTKKLSSLSLRQFSFDDLTVAVCDACLPEGVSVQLGEAALAALEWGVDSSTGELVIKRKAGASPLRNRVVPSLVRSRRFEFAAPINDLSLDASGSVAGLAFSETRAQRTVEVYTREKQGVFEPAREWDCGGRVAVDSGRVLERVHGHRGVVSTAAISPDGTTLVTGGWDKTLIVHGATKVVDSRFGWSLRRVRFSRDGTKLIAAAWTPLNPLQDHASKPAAVVYDVIYDERARVTPASAAPSAASPPAAKAE